LAPIHPPLVTFSGLSQHLTGTSTLPKPLSMCVASGEKMACQWQLHQAEWQTQGYTFNSNFIVLPLRHFEVILGYDWLEAHSPMKVHWAEKWMSIPYGSGSVMIKGILSKLELGTVFHVCQISEDLKLDNEDGSLDV
jgi:hypothetical protein